MARLAEAVGNALLEFAAEVQGTAPTDESSSHEAPGLKGTRPDEAAELPDRLGAKQRLMIQALTRAAPNSLSSPELAELLAVAPNNVNRMARALADRGLVDDLGGRPAEWRLAASTCERA